MNDSAMQTTSAPKRSPNSSLDIFLIVLGILSGICMIPLALFSVRYGWFGQFLIIAVAWMILNYFSGRAIFQLQRSQYPNYTSRAFRFLIIVQAILTIAGIIIDISILEAQGGWNFAWVVAGMGCLPCSLVGFIPGYIAISHYSNKTIKTLTTEEQKQSSIQYNLPKIAYTSPNIITIIFSSILTLVILYYPPAGIGVLVFIVLGTILSVPWLFCNYYCGLTIAKMCYDKIASTQKMRIAYLKLISFQLLLIAIDIGFIVIATGSFSPDFCFDSCTSINIFSFLPWYLIISVIGFIPAYIAVHKYGKWVILHHIPKPTKQKIINS